MNPAIDLNTVKQAFDELKVLKGHTVSFATCDRAGNPNVAPIGSARIVDDHTIHVLQGYLALTLKNLQENPKAAFAVTLRPRLREIFKIPNDKKKVMGYRVYCSFEGVDDNRNAIASEVEHILNRVPFFLKKPFRTFCDKNLKRLLRFTITEVRPIA